MAQQGATRWKQAWADSLSLKTPAERRAALEVFLKAPFDTLLKFSKSGRRWVQRRLPEMVVNEGRSFIFAASRDKNILKDVVHIYARRSRSRIYAEQILICEEIIVAKIPNDCYWVRKHVRAAAGSSGGTQIVNIDESIGGCYPDFKDDFKQDLPRLKSYKFRGGVIQCAWSARDLGLQQFLRKVRKSNDDDLVAALSNFDKTIRTMNVAEELKSECREKLRTLLVPLLTSPHDATQLWANRLWCGLME